MAVDHAHIDVAHIFDLSRVDHLDSNRLPLLLPGGSVPFLEGCFKHLGEVAAAESRFFNGVLLFNRLRAGRSRW
jgi:hypothetical protein